MKKSQNKQILDYLQRGHEITPLQALNLFNCFRLGARIYDLQREGHRIEHRRVFSQATGKWFMSYSMKKAKP